MSIRGSILLVDDEEKILKRLGRALRDEGHDVVEAASARDAQRQLAQRTFDLLVIDNLMPGMTGLELIRELSHTVNASERPTIVMMTAHGSTQIVREAFKLGVEDFLEKPFEIEELIVLAGRAVKSQRLQTERQYLLSERAAEFNEYGIVGRSRAMQDVIQRAELVAQTKSTVLITGETGTGKEMVARAIHHRSAQREMPLIKVNCAAIPDTLLESELFGHVRGAFTGATANKRGRFALADGGSIFLDEIGTMSTAVQAKLLRVLQEREFEPLGAERTQRVDVRVIAATNRDPVEAVRDVKLREDLFYRLNVFTVELPPLRARREDIPLLVQAFLNEFNQRNAKSVRAVDQEAMYLLERYPWPGNIRELRNVIERATILAEGEFIELKHLPPTVVTRSEESLPSLTLSPGTTVDEAERRLILLTLEHTRNNKTRAAEILGISLKTLHNKLNRMKQETGVRS
jgi:DNA-binding NtrC family response regulator